MWPILPSPVPAQRQHNRISESTLVIKPFKVCAVEDARALFSPQSFIDRTQLITGEEAGENPPFVSASR